MAQCKGYRFRIKIEFMLGKFDAIQSYFLMDIASNEATKSAILAYKGFIKAFKQQVRCNKKGL